MVVKMKRLFIGVVVTVALAATVNVMLEDRYYTGRRWRGILG
jgi:hypothetical protein